MSVVESSQDRSVEHLLKAVKELPPADLDRFAREFREWQAAEGGAVDDTALLARIDANSRLPGGQQQRFEELRRKRQDGRLPPDEEYELHALWDRSEEMNVARLEALMELARRRGVDLDTVMHDLHLDQRTRAF
ncbi:MAG TPA: hypothetical protein VFJ58_08920 [Armatimonadota bacterium]|nr:hypothetical protein [Armatimonadota bacterium]